MSSNTGATVTLRGRVATDPVTKVTANGKDMTRFRVVSTRRFLNSDEVWTDGDEFGVWVVAWNGVGAASNVHLRKGDAVIVEGSVSTRPYDDKDGKPGWITEVRASLVALDLMWLRGKVDRTRFPGKDKSEPVDGLDDHPDTAPVDEEPEAERPPWDVEAAAAG